MEARNHIGDILFREQERNCIASECSYPGSGIAIRIRTMANGGSMVKVDLLEVLESDRQRGDGTGSVLEDAVTGG